MASLPTPPEALSTFEAVGASQVSSRVPNEPAASVNGAEQAVAPKPPPPSSDSGAAAEEEKQGDTNDEKSTATVTAIENTLSPPPEQLSAEAAGRVPLSDLARRGEASQSSNYDATMIASMAIRGARSSERGFKGAGSYAHTASKEKAGENPWWEVRLSQQPAAISEIHIFGRPNYGHRLKDCTIEFKAKNGKVLFSQDVPNVEGYEAYKLTLSEPVYEVVTVSISKKAAEGRLSKVEAKEMPLNLNCVQVFGKNYRQVIREQERKIKQLQRIIGKLNEVAFA